jgi:hypothetical protein
MLRHTSNCAKKQEDRNKKEIKKNEMRNREIRSTVREEKETHKKSEARRKN